jgi:hypothetical protein
MGKKPECLRPETRSDFLLRKGHEACAQAGSALSTESRHMLMLEAESYWWQSVAAMTFDTTQVRQTATPFNPLKEVA